MPGPKVLGISQNNITQVCMDHTTEL